MTLVFAVPPSRRVGRSETERAPDDRRSWSLDMRTGVVVPGPSTTQTRRSVLDRRRDDDDDEFDGPDAA